MGSAAGGGREAAWRGSRVHRQECVCTLGATVDGRLWVCGHIRFRGTVNAPDDMHVAAFVDSHLFLEIAGLVGDLGRRRKCSASVGRALVGNEPTFHRP